jgi:hypothetical protein
MLLFFPDPVLLGSDKQFLFSLLVCETPPFVGLALALLTSLLHMYRATTTIHPHVPSVCLSPNVGQQHHSADGWKNLPMACLAFLNQSSCRRGRLLCTVVEMHVTCKRGI